MILYNFSVFFTSYTGTGYTAKWLKKRYTDYQSITAKKPAKVYYTLQKIEFLFILSFLLKDL